jgi:MFS family permease
MLYSGSLISGAFSGLIAAGITGNMDGARGLRAWRWLFIIEGAMTVVVAFCAFFILPNFPRTTTWLTEEERQLAAWRLEEDIGQDDWIDSKHQTFLHGLKLAFTDIKMYILVSLPHLSDRVFHCFMEYGEFDYAHADATGIRWSCFSALSPPGPLPTSSQLWLER